MENCNRYPSGGEKIKSVIRVQHWPEACALDLGDDSHITSWKHCRLRTAVAKGLVLILWDLLWLQSLRRRRRHSRKVLLPDHIVSCLRSTQNKIIVTRCCLRHNTSMLQVY